MLCGEETAKRIEDHGPDIETSSPEQLRSLVASELTPWKRVAQQAKLTTD